MSDEIELKLVLSLADAAAFGASELFPSEPKITRLKSIYFDTPERDLMEAGLSLRIRRAGRKRMQTIKANGAAAAGLFVRPEWERKVPDDTPVLDETSPIPGLLGKRTAAIASQYVIDVERRTWMVDEGDSSIELVLDRGKAEMGERQSPICEIELELMSGMASNLFVLARRIDRLVPVRLGVLTKAERGDRLSQPAGALYKAEPLVMAADMNAAKAFQRVVHACIRHYRLNEELLLAQRNAGALHQCRIALRRLRSAFVIFKPAIGGNDHRRLRKELRWLAAEMGEARNLDVLLERSRDGALRAHLEDARGGAYNRVETAVHSSRTRVLMLDIAEWASCGDWLSVAEHETQRNKPVEKFAAKALDRLRRRVKKDGCDLASLTDEELHEVRKDAKKLRYATEFFKSLFFEKRERRRYKRFSHTLEDLQEKLGALNDLATAPEVVAALGLTENPAATEVLAKGTTAHLRNDAEEIYEHLIDTKRFWR